MEDLIRRSDAVAILEDLQKDHLQFCLIPFRQAIERVQAIPSAESTGDLDNAIYEYVKEGLMDNPYDRPQGEWIDAEIPIECGGSMPIQVCNLCKTFYPLAYTGGGHRFCPNCGADMREREGE